MSKYSVTRRSVILIPRVPPETVGAGIRAALGRVAVK
jgi:hypothetical protein